MANVFPLSLQTRVINPLLSCYQTLVQYLYQDSNATGLGIFRFLFGLCMFLDVFQERGLDDADLRFGDPNHCFFPLFSIVQPLSIQYACVLYSIMWIGSLGIMFGHKLRLSSFLYLIPYVYLWVLDKSRWNNHSYLFALTVLLLSGSNAATFGSIKSIFDKNPDGYPKCPRWNYFILKFQFTLLYVLAAIKKIDADWLMGYSMQNISRHKVLAPFSEILGDLFLDYYVIHIGGFLYDLTAGILLNFRKTRKLGIFMSFIFHGLNSQLFDIGMFPYVCLASLILFCEFDEFPITLFRGKQPMPNSLKKSKIRKNQEKRISGQNKNPKSPDSIRRNTVTFLLLIYMLFQLICPFTHSITKGYNNWTKGLYGYSWDMMIHSWDTLHTKITVRNTLTGTEKYLDPGVWTTNDRWSSHADMLKQYSSCIEKNLANYNLTSIEVYFDIWKSLNRRFQQRIFDPRVNILAAPWSPWDDVPWLLPLLQEFSHWRIQFDRIAKYVGNWSKSSNVIFVADYPGLTLENYLPSQLHNVSLFLLKGEIIVEESGNANMTLKTYDAEGFNFLTQQKLSIPTDKFHKVHTVSTIPSCYMYTYTNRTADSELEEEIPSQRISFFSKFPSDIISLMKQKLHAISRSCFLIVNAYLNLLFDVPMVIRRNIID